MPIAVSCVCGKKFNVKEDLSGKRFKCPECQFVLVVPAIKPPPLPEIGKPDVVEDDRPKDEDAKQRGRRGPAGDLDVPSPRGDDRNDEEGREGRSKRAPYVWLGVGGVLLLCVCIGCGIGGYFLFLAGPGDPEKVIVGAWKFDRGAGTDIGQFLEFKPDGTFNRDDVDANVSNVSYVNGRWKCSGKKGNTMRLELTYFILFPGARKAPETRQTLECTIVSPTIMQLRNPRHGDSGNRYNRIN